MKRRDFLAASCFAGMAPLAATSLAGAERADAPNKEFYELRLYRMQSAEKAAALVKFLGDAAIPAFNRIGVKPVGVFQFLEGDSSDLYVLLPHGSLESVVTATTRLLADEQYVKAGAGILDTPKKEPAFARIESSLMLAFDNCPKVEIPTKEEGRIFQLRIYESHNQTKAKRKVEMFNEGGEIDLFRKTGMPPVFFGETLIGTQFPNLTYMLGFDDMAAKDAGWKAFLGSPEWDAMKKKPIYKDTVSGITNLMLKPAACSQI